MGVYRYFSFEGKNKNNSRYFTTRYRGIEGYNIIDSSSDMSPYDRMKKLSMLLKLTQYFCLWDNIECDEGTFIGEWGDTNNTQPKKLNQCMMDHYMMKILTGINLLIFFTVVKGYTVQVVYMRDSIQFNVVGIDFKDFKKYLLMVLDDFNSQYAKITKL